MTDAGLLDAACRRYIGRAAVDVDWRDLLTVRDALVRLLNAEIDRRQVADVSASTSPTRQRLQPVADGSKAASESISSRRDLPAPNTVRRHVTPVVAPDGHPTHNPPPDAA